VESSYTINRCGVIAKSNELTSFDGRSLKERYPDKPDIRKRYLPIRPSYAHPDNFIQLRLDHNMELRKPSYINTQKSYKVNILCLEKFDKNCNFSDFKLDLQSYSTLTDYTHFTPPATSTYGESSLPLTHHPAAPIRPPVPHSSLSDHALLAARQAERTPYLAQFREYSHHTNPPASPSPPQPSWGLSPAECGLLVGGICALYSCYRLFLFGKWAWRWSLSHRNALTDSLRRVRALPSARVSSQISYFFIMLQARTFQAIGELPQVSALLPTLQDSVFQWLGAYKDTFNVPKFSDAWFNSLTFRFHHAFDALGVEIQRHL